MSSQREIPRVGFVIACLLTMDAAVAQDRTWKDCELADHNADRSIVACSKLLNGGPTNVRAAAFHNRGLAWAAKGNLDQAVSDISQGIRLDPRRAYRWQERGEIYTRQGKYEQAIADITEAIRIDPVARAFRFHNRAEAYRGLGDIARAIADFDDAIRLDPVARSFRFYDLGNALRDGGQYDRALAAYDTALKLEPTNAWILLDRGRAKGRIGRHDDAKRDFDAAIALDPSNAELRSFVEAELAALTNPRILPPAQGIPAPPPPRAPSQPGASQEVSSGSAFAVSRQGHLLTNNHVVSGCALVEVVGVGPATVLSRDVGNDLALIQTNSQRADFEPVRITNQVTRLGEEVVALGYPLRGVLGDGLNVTTGTISALSGLGNDSTKLQFTAAIQPGNSGGALVDRTGALVGVVASKLSDMIAINDGGFVPQGVNFAIRKEIAIAFLAAQGMSLEPFHDATYMHCCRYRTASPKERSSNRVPKLNSTRAVRGPFCKTLNRYAISPRGASDRERMAPACHRVPGGGQIVEMAGGELLRGDLLQLRLVRAAAVEHIGTAGVEAAAAGRIDRARHVALEDDRGRGRAPGSGTGTAESSALGVGMLGRGEDLLPAAPVSTILPRYITATRWVMCSTIARSWLMNSSARPSLRCRSCSRLTICALTETSSAETASSQTIRSGSAASARAMPMRWRWPPENSWGRRCSASRGRRTVSSSACDASRRGRPAMSARPKLRIGSARMSRTRMRGLRLENGSWNTTCMRRRMRPQGRRPRDRRCAGRRARPGRR